MSRNIEMYPDQYDDVPSYKSDTYQWELLASNPKKAAKDVGVERSHTVKWYNIPQPKRIAEIDKTYVLMSAFFGLPQPLFKDKLWLLRDAGLANFEGDLTKAGIQAARELYAHRPWPKEVKTKAGHKYLNRRICYIDCDCDNGILNRAKVVQEYGTPFEYCTRCNYTYVAIVGEK